MNESSKKIDTKRLKSFVRHLCVIAKRHKDREEARSELQKQLQRLKRFSSKKKEMDEELKELDRKISLVLEKEAQLLGIKHGESAISKGLMNRIMSKVIENRGKVRHINNSIKELKERLEYYIKVKTEREKRIDELENRIRAKVGKKKNFSLLKNKLKRLEGVYHKLKKKGVDVSKIEGRINDLKLRLSA